MQLGDLGKSCELPHAAGSGAEPQPKSNLVPSSLKIWHLVATSLKIFLQINWPNLGQFEQKGMSWHSWQIDMHACRSTDLLSLSAYLEDCCFGRLGIWSLQAATLEIHQFTIIMQNSETVAATFTSILWPKKVPHWLVLHDRQHSDNNINHIT